MRQFVPVLFALLSLWGCQKHSDIAEINQLDRMLQSDTDFYVERVHRIDLLKKEYEDVFDNGEKAFTAVRLYNEYFNFDKERALFYARKADSLAARTNNVELVNATGSYLAICLAESGRIGMANNRLDLMYRNSLSDDLKYQYYLAKIIVNKEDEHFATESVLIANTRKRAHQYRDSLLMCSSAPEMVRMFVNANRLLVAGRNNDLISSLQQPLSTMETWSYEWGNACYLIGRSYENLGDTENAITYYARSAISDLKCGVRTGMSMKALSSLLYKNGDVARAYNYVLKAMSDANASHSRLASAEAAENFIIIEDSLRIQEARQRKSTILVLVLLVVLCMFALFFAVKSHRRGRKINEVNTELKESSRLKEVYLAFSMSQNAQFIKALEKLQRKGLRTARQGTKEDLERFFNVEFKPEMFRTNFYSQFDEAILKIFPEFVEQFNSLLKDSSRIVPKENNMLTPELRIYALIRLGITSSSDISSFLQYSPSTVYNYRTQMRNCAKGSRDSFETEVMNLCR